MTSALAILDIVESRFDIFDTSENRPSDYCRSFNDLRAAAVWYGPCTANCTEKRMFRISTVDTRRERRLVVEGTLIQPWVPELRRTWSDAGESLDGRQLVIDLSNATSIDADGESAIFDLMKEGAKFCCSDVLTKHVLKQLAHKCQTRLSKVLNRHGANGARCSEREEQ